MTISPLSPNRETSKQLGLEGLSSETQGEIETTRVKGTGSSSLSPEFLKHEILPGVEETMKLEENVENGNPPTWKEIFTQDFKT